MANAYPNPCLTCHEAATCGKGYGCQRWKTRYRYRQKQINAYAKKILQKKPVSQSMFAYEHPDTVRRYLAEGPCKRCGAEPVCTTPCPAYLRWWDARMQITRKRVGI